MMKMIKFLVVALTLFGLASCEKEEGNVDSSDGGVLKIELQRPDDLSIGNILIIYAETSNEFNCRNYSIQTSTNEEVSDLGITYGAITKPEVCLTAFGPATSSTQFEDLPLGEHDFYINYKNQKVDGVIEVTASSYKLTLEENSVIDVVIDEVSRMVTLEPR